VGSRQPSRLKSQTGHCPVLWNYRSHRKPSSSTRLGQVRVPTLSRRDRSAAAYSASSGYRWRLKLPCLLYRIWRPSRLRIILLYQPQQRGPTDPWILEEHSGGGCQKIHTFRNTSLAVEEPTLARTCRYLLLSRPSAQESAGTASHLKPTIPGFKNPVTMLARCLHSLHCHRCVKTTTDHGEFRLRFQEPQEYTIIP
jgi:hypothetical protein